MSILNDQEIAELCVKPDYFHVYGDCEKPVIVGLTHDQKQVERMLVNPNVCMVKADEKALNKRGWRPLISPFCNESISQVEDRKILSYGLSSFGYDVKLAEECKIFTNQNAIIIDPKRFDENCLVDGKIYVDDDGSLYSILPPHSYMLARTVEYFVIPRNMLIICLGKSTMARAGIIINVTPLEPEFEGNIVIEISNSTSLPAKVYLGEGIAQFLFLRGNPCNVSYADRKGKYQGQTGLTLPRV